MGGVELHAARVLAALLAAPIVPTITPGPARSKLLSMLRMRQRAAAPRHHAMLRERARRIGQSRKDGES